MKGENAVPAAVRERGWYVSRETARGFLAGERRCARYLGLAFFFWALAGVPWVMLPPGGEQRPLGMGLCVLLGICAAVAAMFSQREDYAVLRREPLLLDQAVLKELRDEYRALRGRYLLVAAHLWCCSSPGFWPWPLPAGGWFPGRCTTPWPFWCWPPGSGAPCGP